MQAEHLVTVLLLVQDTQVLSKTVFRVVALALLLMVGTQRAKHSLVSVVLVVIFLHGLVRQRQQRTRVVEAVVLGGGLRTGAGRQSVLLLAV
jgi:hypothetical protein